MEFSTIISLAALTVSVISLIISWYFGFRDRSKLVTTSKFFPENEYGAACIRVKAVNVGRRLVILRLLGGEHSDGGWSGTYLDKVEGGLYLKENEFFEKTLSEADMYGMGLDGDFSEYKNLWFEDSRGHHHMLKDSAENIRMLLASK